MSNKIIILVRHGEYTPVTEMPTDGPLTERGQQQASYLADYLQTRHPNIIYTSSFIRAQQTAQIIHNRLPHVPLIVDEGLRECIPSVPPGYEEYFQDVPDNFLNEGGAFAEAAYNTYFTQPSPDDPKRIEVLVTHGNLIGYLLARVLTAPTDGWVRVGMGNCCWSSVHYWTSGRFRLMRHNIDEHLPTELRAEA